MDDEEYKAWFVGPKGENSEILEELVLQALRGHCEWRKNFHHQDPIFYQEEEKESDHFKKSITQLKNHFNELNQRMKNSVPFFSPRYIGHMGTSNTISSIVGHFIGVLYNNNNTSEESASVTIKIEAEAVQMLADMLKLGPDAWGHFTSGGSLANYHCLWRARDIMLFPYQVSLVKKIDPPKSIEQIYDLISEYRNDPEVLKNSPYQIGFPRFIEKCQISQKKWLVNKSAHYSIYKALHLLGFGNDQIIPIDLDENWAMDPKHLQEILDEDVLGVIGVYGTTENGSLDDFSEMIRIRNSCNHVFWLHADCAWGGYYLTTPYDQISKISPEWKKRFLKTQEGLNECDSFIIDPHKAGYIPFSAGVSLYKNHLAREIHKYQPKYVNIKERNSENIWDVPLLSSYTIEGSRATTGPLATWLTHQTTPLTPTAHGVLMENSVVSCLLFQKLMKDSGYFIFLNEIPMTGISCFTVKCQYPLKVMNRIVEEMYSHSVLDYNTNVHNVEFIIAKTTYSADTYSNELNRFIDKHKISGKLSSENPWEDDQCLTMIRNVFLNPFLLEARQDFSYLEEYVNYMISLVKKATKKILNEPFVKDIPLNGNILIVEDNKELNQHICETLSKTFHTNKNQIVTKRSLQEAQQAIEKIEFHAVITGIDLGPGSEKDGLKLIDQLIDQTSMKGLIIFTLIDKEQLNEDINIFQQKRPDLKLFYQQHFPYHTEEKYYHLNQLSNTLWKILN